MECDDPQFLCPHVANGATEVFAWFTGHGKNLNWACAACAKAFPAEPAPWIPAAPDWLTANRDAIYWDGVCGQPEVKHRESRLRFSSHAVTLSDEGPFMDVQPVAGSPFYWQALTAAGSLVLFSSKDAIVITSLPLDDLGFEITAGTGLCLSPKGEFAVVFETSGSHAVLLNARTGKCVRQLSRGNYRPQNSHFPVAFFCHDGKPFLIAGSEWNRLDLYDPLNGEVISKRDSPVYQNNETSPHYLNYFHGGLSVSPDHQFVVDNGWVWSPVGNLRAWSLPAWLKNPWESEDGPTCHSLAWRDYWDGPLCWTDSSTLAFWGWGRHDDWLVPAVVFCDVQNGETLRWFPGPKVRQPRAWPPRELAQSLFFDDYLFAVHDEEGATVWDIASGECLLVDPQVKPWRYHPDSKEFIEITPTGFRISQLIS